jgi:hypothetical protein
MLFRAGWNAVQVQRWLGHHKPSFTIDTYVHLLEEDLTEPDFLDAKPAAARWATGGQPDSQRSPETPVPVIGRISRNGEVLPDGTRQVRGGCCLLIIRWSLVRIPGAIARSAEAKPHPWRLRYQCLGGALSFGRACS